MFAGQQKPAADAAKPPDSVPPAQHDHRFEVVSIHPGPPDGRLTHMPGPSYTPGRFRQEATTISGLALQAFGKKQGFELESPQWMNTTYFAIDATIPDGATKADLPIMIQHLLEDRFALKYHHETRQMAGYELVVAKPDPRLAKSATPDYDGARLSGMSGVDTKSGVPQFDKSAGSVDMCFSYDRGVACALHCRNKTMKALATDLARRLEVPVTDATGLQGGYDYTVIFTQESVPMPGNVVSPGGGVPAATSPDAPSDYPLLRDALQDQLGLKLKSSKNVPVDVVIIDSANKVPTEN
jgi:uncharacterized protein (TIGR03435 family)